MGFTHYWSELELAKYPEGLISIFNQAYQDFLRVGVTIEGERLNLFSVFYQIDNAPNLFDKHFHEYSIGTSGEPLIFDKNRSGCFCKTARKSYDVAVVLTLHLASVVLNKIYSSDGDVIYRKEQIEQYVQDNLDDSFQYDFKRFYELFDIWLNKCIAFSDDNQEEIQNIQDMKQYSRVSDLPDEELEYIGEQIKKGVTFIYLNNNQIVDISFRN